MRKCGKGTLLLMSAVMATSLFTGCGKGKSSQAFAVALAANEYEPYLSFDINDENTVKYLKCETLDVDTNTEGIHLVGTNEFPLGWAKIKKGRLKNKYSSSWRWL